MSKIYDIELDGNLVRELELNSKGLFGITNNLIGLINQNSLKQGSTVRFDVKLYARPIVSITDGKESMLECLILTFNCYDSENKDETYKMLYNCEHLLTGKDKFFVDTAVDKLMKTFFIEVITVSGIVMIDFMNSKRESNAG
jgi:hypothetical protein